MSLLENATSAPTPITLKPGEAYVQAMRLDRWVAHPAIPKDGTYPPNLFTAPGEYTITARYTPDRRIDLDGLMPPAQQNLFLDVTAGIDLSTGIVTWTFTSLDPQTLDQPSDPLAGFLPPNVTAPMGEGYVSYRVRPKLSSATGTRIDAQATVVFDTEAPLDTRQGAEVHQHQPHRAVLAEVVDQSRLDLAERGDEHAFIVVSRRGLSKRAARFRPPTAPGPSRRP